jgi:hypothetical protein
MTVKEFSISENIHTKGEEQIERIKTKYEILDRKRH